MNHIRIIPKDSLCPHCELGMMITSTMKAKGKKLGPHWRKIPAKCDNCGKPGSVAKTYVGIIAPSKDDPAQTLLFS